MQGNPLFMSTSAGADCCCSPSTERRRQQQWKHSTDCLCAGRECQKLFGRPAHCLQQAKHKIYRPAHKPSTLALAESSQDLHFEEYHVAASSQAHRLVVLVWLVIGAPGRFQGLLGRDLCGWYAVTGSETHVSSRQGDRGRGLKFCRP